ncbi:little elongation complex subunit 2 isoform X2 [Pseudophryne corroboree]|uniref:little elongation complex subunit 2 isoform X2 n=1 Tax=Pseudophryne corroboree TaxID=495146 RepID=UPI0030818768
MEAAGELRWDIEPCNGRNFFFTRESYEKYSMAPSLAELLLLSNKIPPQRPDDSPRDVRWMSGPGAAVGPFPVISPDDSSRVQPGRQRPAPAEPPKVDCKAISPQPPVTVISSAKIIPFPEPRVPFPRYSSLTALEQETYVKLIIKFLNSKNPNFNLLKEYQHYQILKSKFSIEHAEFQKFLQNAARSCAEDYNVLCTNAALYIQEMLKASQAVVRRYPELYTIHEITSISGGKFIPDLSLKLEKCLLKLGSVKFMKIIFPTQDIPLATSYKEITRMMPPVKKAAHVHTSVSSDPNISKLASKYCPQVVLTTQVLFTLLNNHGSVYNEQWEIPVRVETIVTESRSSKVIYLDSPLPKKMLNPREKNQMFHEVLLDHFMVKNSSIILKILSLDREEEIQLITSLNAQAEKEYANRSVICVSNDVEFENDVTELETFGSIEDNTNSNSADSDCKSLESVHQTHTNSLLDKLKIEKQIINNINSTKLGFDSDEINVKEKEESSEDKSNLSSDTEMMMMMMGTSLKSVPNQATRTTENNSDEDDRLVIDIDCKKSKYCNEMTTQSVPSTPVSPQQLPRRSARKISKDVDPVGQILKMQTQLLKPGAKMEKASVPNTEPSQNTAHFQQPAPLGSDTLAEPQRKVDAHHSGDNKKSLLSNDLLEYTEDEAAYNVPAKENCTYKLFSLDDMLLLLKSTVNKARTVAMKKKCKKQIPVFLLTKVNYQTCYGVESLTESESCRLWTESLIHSNCLLYVGHVDALTSKFFMLEEVTAEKLKEKISIFKPANCLNTLRHILKWVTGLQDGSYLLSHVSGDSSVYLYKNVTVNKRGTYNLHDSHSNPPKIPSFVSVPWVPLNPNLLLNYHIQHGRPPCTFPPASGMSSGRNKVNQPRKAPPHEKATDLPTTNMTVAAKPPKKNKGRNRLKRLKEKQKVWKTKAAMQKKT